MTKRRIRIVSKQRSTLDIGKYVLAVMGVHAPSGYTQLTLPLDDVRRPHVQASVIPPSQTPEASSDQLALPLDDQKEEA